MNYNFLYQKLSQRTERLRKDKQMTQEELAEKAGLHRAYFWDIENGRNISIKTAYKVARALGVKLSELFDFWFIFVASAKRHELSVMAHCHFPVEAVHWLVG